jgi:hypothetical protein
MIENVSIEGTHCALIIRADYHASGIEFFTDDSDSLQIGYMNRAKGYQIRPHIHRPIERTVEYTHEVLLIKTGCVKVNFYDNNQIFQKSIILKQGDVILLTLCGHGFEIIEDCEIIEVKQGPYAGTNDKIRF